jgi:hypothetical protein
MEISSLAWLELSQVGYTDTVLFGRPEEDKMEESSSNLILVIGVGGHNSCHIILSHFIP